MEYSIACSDVYYLITNMEENEIKKIPQKLLELICILKIDDYIPTIDLSKPLEEQKLSEATKGLISLIYNKYLGTEEEKKKYNKECKEYLKKQEMTTEIQFKKTPNKDIAKKQTAVIEYKQKHNFFSKIIEKIKRIFH